MNYHQESFISRHIVAIFIIRMTCFVSVFLIVILHDVFVEHDKNIKRQTNILNSETCVELQDNIKFFNDLQAGDWIKPYDVSIYENRMQELNCK